MTAVLTELAPFKVNLFLHITGRRADGYHLMRTLFAFADTGDEISLAPADRFALIATGRFAGDVPITPDNLVWRAAQAWADARNMHLPSVRLTLNKHVPVASGLGGGSADAAATLRLLDRWHGDRSPDLLAIAARLGADVPACLEGGAQWASGIGDVLTPIEATRAVPALVVNPLIGLSTPAVFKAYAAGQPPYHPDLWPQRGAWQNDLEGPAQQLCPEIANLLQRLRATPGCDFAAMSGSGASCFALYSSTGARDAAAAMVAAPWQVACHVAVPKD